jgi:hypothetical protein
MARGAAAASTLMCLSTVATATPTVAHGARRRLGGCRSSSATARSAIRSSRGAGSRPPSCSPPSPVYGILHSEVRPSSGPEEVSDRARVRRATRKVITTQPPQSGLVGLRDGACGAAVPVT